LGFAFGIFRFRFNPVKMYIFTILIIGLSGVVAQVLLLRELLVVFYGNELTIGVILANWILSEALGVFSLGRAIAGIRKKIDVFFILQALFALCLPAAIYLARIAKVAAGIPQGEAVGLWGVFIISLLANLPVAACHGALFSLACKIYPAQQNEPVLSISRVYAWETAGTMLGGIMLTYIFIPYFNSFQVAFMVSLLNLLICFIFFRPLRGLYRFAALFLLAIFAVFILAKGIDDLERLSISRQWQNQQVLDYQNSIYGNITVTRQLEQYTFFYNGVPAISAPYPDIAFVQEFGNLPLLFHDDPRDILVIGGGAGGLISEILGHPVERLHYAELDPLLIEMLARYPTALTLRELSDRRVRIVNTDGRFYLRISPDTYDAALIGFTVPRDLSTNRLFTAESFGLIKKRLNPGGILAFCLPGSLVHLSRQLRDTNASVLSALKSAFPFVRVIPGDYNMFLASDSPRVIDLTVKGVSERLASRRIKPGLLVPDYLAYRLDRKWVEWFNQSISGATKKVNRDFAPIAVFETLVLWNKKFSPSMGAFLQSFAGLNLATVALGFLLLTLALSAFLRCSRKGLRIVAYSIFTTGFFGMLANLILIFAFQVFYGYLYRHIGILISIFMTGIALGSILISAGLKSAIKGLRAFALIEFILVAFVLIMAGVITRGFLPGYYTVLAFILLFLISGILMGLEFPLASRLYLETQKEVGATAGILYASDLMGGWLAGILGGVILLPVLGLFNTCLVIVLFKLSSLIPLLSNYRKLETGFIFGSASSPGS